MLQPDPGVVRSGGRRVGVYQAGINGHFLYCSEPLGPPQQAAEVLPFTPHCPQVLLGLGNWPRVPGTTRYIANLSYRVGYWG